MRRATPLCALASLCFVASAAPGEVYKWVDRAGTVHFSQDYNTLGGSRHTQQEKAASGGVEVLPLHDHRPPHAEPESADEKPAKTHEILMHSTSGGNYMLRVRLNKRLTVPMLLDTGASDIVITDGTAHSLGLTDRDIIAERAYETANGTIRQPVVRLRNVSVGDANATWVRGSISSSMRIGLLGTSFLKQFEYTIRGRTLILRDK